MIDEEIANLEAELRSLVPNVLSMPTLSIMPRSSIEKADYFYGEILLKAFESMEIGGIECSPVMAYSSNDPDLQTEGIDSDDKNKAPNRIFCFRLNDIPMFIFYYTQIRQTSMWSYGRIDGSNSKFSVGYSKRENAAPDDQTVKTLLVSKLNIPPRAGRL